MTSGQPTASGSSATPFARVASMISAKCPKCGTFNTYHDARIKSKRSNPGGIVRLAARCYPCDHQWWDRGMRVDRTHARAEQRHNEMVRAGMIKRK